MKKIIQAKKYIRAFSTGEVVLSMAVLVTGVLALLGLLSGNMRDAFLNRDLIIASQLAQEGVELVRNVRDSDFVNGGSGFSDSALFNATDRFCRIGLSNGVSGVSYACTTTFNASGNRYDLAESGNQIYEYRHFNRAGKFKRFLYILYDNANQTAAITSYVYFGDVGSVPVNGTVTGCTAKNKCIFVQTRLSAWH